MKVRTAKIVGFILIVLMIAVYGSFVKQVINKQISILGGDVSKTNFLTGISTLFDLEQDELEYEMVEIGVVYDNLSFVSTRGEMYRLCGISLSEENYDYNMKYVKDIMENKTHYIVFSGDVDENNVPYCYVYTSEPTHNDNTGTSLNAYLKNRGFCH